MKRRIPRILATLAAMVMVISLIGGAAAETQEQQRYEQAQSLLAGGKYEEAQAAFTALGAYRDATKYAMYAKALLYAENGEYASAQPDMRALGTFMDCELRADYYNAVLYERIAAYEEAWKIYKTMPDFLDVPERIASMPEKINARDYGVADQWEKEGKLEEALEAFIALVPYRDSADRAVAVKEKINARDYAKAEKMEENGKLEAALEAFVALGDYRDSAERAEGVREKIRARDYALAGKYEEKERYSDAYKLYTGLGDYLDSAEKAARIHDPAMYEDALALADGGKYREAYRKFAELGDYRDSADKAYVLGVAEFADETNDASDRVFVFQHHDLYGIVNYEDNVARAALYDHITAFDHGVARYEYKNKWGLAYPDLSTTENIFSLIYSFDVSRGKRLAIAAKGNGYGYIDERAEAVIPAVYTALSGFNSEGVCFVVKENKWGLADDTGEILCRPSWTVLNHNNASRENGRITYKPGTGSTPVLVQQEDGLYGYISWTGETLVSPRFDRARDFSDGLAAVRENDLWGFIDRNGNYVIQPEYQEVTDFRNGRAEVWIPESGWHIIDKDNRRVYFTSSGLKEADNLMAEGKSREAAEIYETLADVDPTLKERAQSAWYQAAEDLLREGDYAGAIEAFSRTKGYADSAERILRVHYSLGELALAAGEWDTASAEFAAAKDYGNAKERIAEPYYRKAEKLLEAGDTAGAIGAFGEAAGYKDAAERIGRIHYDLAEAALAAGEWDTASAEFAAAKDYSDAKDRIPEPYYRKAEKLLEEGDAKGALEAFAQAGQYRDAREQTQKIHYDMAEAALAAGEWDTASREFRAAERYNNAMTRVREPYYRQGEALLAAGDYDSAAAAFKKAANYGDAEQMVTETAYRKAEALYAAGDYAGAYRAFRELGNYKDAAELVKNDENFAALAEEERRTNFRTAGSVVTFGAWEQDGDGGNGAEPIEWVVLDVQDGRALLFSVYGLETQNFSSQKGKNAKHSWAKSVIRQWLNNDFLKNAFTKEEQAAVLTSSLQDKLSKTNSKDRVFLLSMDEVSTYIKKTEYYKCFPTAQALTGNPSMAKEGNASWWLRSVSPASNRVYCVRFDGTDMPMLAGSKSAVTRPAMWVDLEKIPY